MGYEHINLSKEPIPSGIKKKMFSQQMNSDQQSLCSYIRNKNNNIGPTAAAHVQLSKKKKKK